MIMAGFNIDRGVQCFLPNGGTLEATRVSPRAATIFVPGWDYTAAEIGDLILQLQAVQRSLNQDSEYIEILHG